MLTSICLLVGTYHQDFSWSLNILMYYSVGKDYCQIAVLATWTEDDWRWLKMTEDEACIVTYFWFVQLWTFNGKLLTTVQIMNRGWGPASGKGHEWIASIDTTDSARDLSMKLSLFMCNYSNCPGWRNGCNLLTYVVPSYLWWGSSYLWKQLWLILDSGKSCCVPLKSSKSAVCCWLRLPPQW